MEGHNCLSLLPRGDKNMMDWSKLWQNGEVLLHVYVPASSEISQCWVVYLREKTLQYLFWISSISLVWLSCLPCHLQGGQLVPFLISFLIYKQYVNYFSCRSCCYMYVDVDWPLFALLSCCRNSSSCSLTFLNPSSLSLSIWVTIIQCKFTALTLSILIQ